MVESIAAITHQENIFVFGRVADQTWRLLLQVIRVVLEEIVGVELGDLLFIFDGIFRKNVSCN